MAGTNLPGGMVGAGGCAQQTEPGEVNDPAKQRAARGDVPAWCGLGDSAHERLVIIIVVVCRAT